MISPGAVPALLPLCRPIAHPISALSAHDDLANPLSCPRAGVSRQPPPISDLWRTTLPGPCYHPWLDVQGHAAFTWSLLGAVAVRTERIGLATGVTCPSFRYHPAIIAQAAATVAIVSDGRFTLGVGAGERLNEHVVGREFPGVRRRHDVLREALEIIRLLWQGGYRSYQGKHLQLEDARVFDLPDPASARRGGQRRGVGGDRRRARRRPVRHRA